MFIDVPNISIFSEYGEDTEDVFNLHSPTPSEGGGGGRGRGRGEGLPGVITPSLHCKNVSGPLEPLFFIGLQQFKEI
jgi:hypothetical protein